MLRQGDLLNKPILNARCADVMHFFVSLWQHASV